MELMVQFVAFGKGLAGVLVSSLPRHPLTSQLANIVRSKLNNLVTDYLSKINHCKQQLQVGGLSLTKLSPGWFFLM